MAVTANAKIFINPIPRIDEVSIREKDGLLARWHAVYPLTGDGSGGDYSWNFYFDTASGAVFGNHTLIDFNFYDVRYFGAIVGPYGYVDFSPYERSSSPNVYDLSFHRYFEINNRISARDGVPPCSFKFKLNEAGLTQFVITLGPNTNTVAAIASIAGYLYDERFIRG